MKRIPFSQVWACVAIFAYSSDMQGVRAASLYWDGSSSGADADGGIGTWIADPAATNWDTSAIGGNDVPWTDGSEAIFGGTGGLVSVSGTVSASSISFGAAGYSLSGGKITLTGTPFIGIAGNDVALGSAIAGSVPITKTGSGTLTISGNNTNTGAFIIAEGTVKVGSASAFGTIQKGTTISPGATLELNGQNLGTEQVTFSGSGVGGAGAIVNNGPSDLYALQYATLAGPATVGGTQRWDIRGNGSLNMGGHTLTKTGPGDFHLVSIGVTSPGNIDVKEGSFWIENSSTLAGTAAHVITIRNGAMLAQWSNGSYIQQRTASFETNTTWKAAFGSSSWDGPVTLAGSTTLDVANNAFMSHSGVISGPGSFTKTGTGTWTISSLNTYSGGTHVNTGKVVLNAGNAGIGTLRGAVTVNSGGILELAGTEALGNLAGSRVSPLTINGGLVDNTSNGGNSCDVVNLFGATLRSSAGFNSPTAKNYFILAGGSVVNSLAAEIPSVISGRLDLGSGISGTIARFNVIAGNATEDLRIDAAISESNSGRGITKEGNGQMVLNGECLFTGGTTVQAGTLLLGAGGSLTGSPVTVETGGRFGSSTSGKSLASLVAGPGSSLILPAQAGNTTMIMGALTLPGGSIGISPVLGAGTVAGTYDLITAGDITGIGTPAIDMAGAFGSTRAVGSVAVNGNKLQLILSGTGANLVWNNASAGASATGTWDSTLVNFSNDGGNDVFQSFDFVTFNDSVAPGSPKTIALGATLAPALVVVDNSNGAYTFNSNGGLAGAGSLVKTGTSTLTIGGTDSYAMSGDITAGGGILDFTGKTISIGQLTIANGGEFNNATASVKAVNLQAGSASANLRGTTAWTKSTGGTVTLTANNHLSGTGTVSEGALIVGNAASPNASGSLGTGAVTINVGASVTFSRSDAPVIANTFSGSGALNLLGGNNGSNGASSFSFTSDNSGFSGPLTVTNASLSVLTGKELGSGDVTLSGRSALNVADSMVPNALHLSTTGYWGNGSSGVGHLNLNNATLAGSIDLAGSSTTGVSSNGVPGGSSNPFTRNTISGPIRETGGPASLVLTSSYSGNIITLSGASTYTGPTTISGSLVVNLSGSLGATAVTVGGLSTITGTGSIGSGGSLTFNNLAILKLTTEGGALTVNGDVNLGPKTKIAVDVAQNRVMDGPIPVLNYTGTLTGTAAQLEMDYLPNYRKAVFDFSPGHITLDIGGKTIIWKGTSGYFWEVGGTKLWNTTGIGETESFYKGDAVVFDDTGYNQVRSVYAMEPSSVLFNNSSKNYAVSANITGPCALTKRGSGGLTLVSNNSHSGGTFIEAGRLEAQSTALGTGPVSVAAGATLAGDAKIPGPVTIAGTLDPGLAGQSWPSVLSTGPTILTGTYVCQLDTNSSDTLAVTGDLDISGSTLTLNKTFSYSKPTFTIATYTGTLTGRFASVTGMPPGYELRYDTVGKQIVVAGSGADLEMSIYASPEPVVAGTDLTYTLQVRNHGPLDAENVTIGDSLPFGTTFISASAPGGWTSTTPAVGANGTVTFESSKLPANGTATFTVVAKLDLSVAHDATLTATATASTSSTDPTPGNNSATTTTTAKSGADLRIALSDSPGPVIAGAELTYTINLVNNGPLGADSVSVTDTLPAETTFVSLNLPAGWFATTPAVGSTGTVTITRPLLATTGTASFVLVVKVASNVASGTVLSNTASASSATLDDVAGNSSATATSTVNTSADLAIGLTATPTTVKKGANVTYSITLTNKGPSDAKAPTVTLPIPAQMTFVSATAATGWSATAPAVGANGTASFTRSSLAMGTKATFKVVAKVKSGAANGTVLTAIVSASGGDVDPFAVNNVAAAIASVGTVNPSAVQPITTGIAANPKNGLYNVNVKVTNTTPRPINGFRLHVNFDAYKADYPDLRLENATSTSKKNVYIDYPKHVAVDATVTVKLSFHTSARRFPSPFKPLLTVDLPASSKATPILGEGVQASLVKLPDKTIQLSFPTLAGHWYRVRYSSDLEHWTDCPVPFQATSTSTSWIDSGPPYTVETPANTPARFYLVNEINAP